MKKLILISILLIFSAVFCLADEEINFDAFEEGDPAVPEQPAEWKASSGVQQYGAIDGVSQASIKPALTSVFNSGTWNLKDASGNQIMEGLYRIHANVCSESITAACFYADVNINGTGSAVNFTLSSSTSECMSGGSVTYTP